ncbi:MAG: RNA polymerase II transcription factor B subunit 4, partial [Candelina submexicana]
LDTNPHAWSLLNSTLPLSKAIANILVFINAHLAFNNANKIAVVASHSQHAQWLYPTPRNPHHTVANADAPQASSPPPTQPPATSDDANKYRPFRLIETEILTNLRSLIFSTTEEDLTSTTTTMMAGALTLALAYINKQTQEYNEFHGGGGGDRGGNDGREPERRTMLQSRILVLSVSGDLAFQYIPIMNCIFAAQRSSIPIDILKLHGSSAFLQQASDATLGTYLSPSTPQGLLQYLLMTFLPDQTSRQHLIPPTQVNVDFRAACFCHRRVVDVGFVCSICLSIFCSPPPDATCLTCGTHLALGNYGGAPAVIPRSKKKKKKRKDGQ